MEAVRIRILGLFKRINTIDGEYLVIDDDKICKTLREARPERPRGASGRQQHLEETDMPPAKKRCSPSPPRAPKPPQPKPPLVKANTFTTVPTYGE
ncbi:unnamed protein product [Cylicocyclus nassatus]|uniref:Uncharacterized protein n=1 Tax=Cylicocyclus nassatus TaxID=53992 RepID=A0AA36H0V0_CYLNA|nr:unnamed protein product [Cylicocyclus nassatus]